MYLKVQDVKEVSFSYSCGFMHWTFYMDSYIKAMSEVKSVCFFVFLHYLVLFKTSLRSTLAV